MDTTVGLLIVTVLIAVAFFFGLRWFIRARSQYGGIQIVTCPETQRPASVEVNAVQTAFTAALGTPLIGLQNCSRWPIKKDCGQECLLNVHVAPDDCLVYGVLMKWYRGKKCVFCRKTFADLHLTDHKPALQSPEGKLLEWSEVSITNVSTVLQTWNPVCWDCYIAQSFAIEHPDLVVYRPWRNTTFSKHQERPTSHPTL